MRTQTATRQLSPLFLFAMVIIAASLAACYAVPPSSPQLRTAPTAAAATPSTAPISAAPRFEPAPCRFQSTGGQAIECGYLVVPEDRSQPNSPTIRLHVAIVRSFGPHPAADPVIYLHGGAGSGALDGISGIVQIFFSILTGRDLIVFDQRGVGYSQPSLDCPEVDQLRYDELATRPNRADHQTRLVQAYTACHDRLRSQGVNLDAYNTAASAADVNDLRLALGYDQVNLYGISYGTRLALTVMRDFPSSVRSAILDSTVPLDADLEAAEAPNAERAFNLLFDRCAGDKRCNAAFPRLKDTFYSLVARLDGQPVQVQITHPTTGKVYSLVVDGDRLIGYLFDMLYATAVIPDLPKLISDMSQGDYALFSSRAGAFTFRWDRASEGEWASTICSEEFAYSSPQAVASAAVQVRPRLRETVVNSAADDFARCDAWGVKKAAPIENQPVVSNIPTLVLAGEFDPITPPALGRQAMATLSRAYFFESPVTGHGVLGGGGLCPGEIAANFIGDPDKSPAIDCPPVTLFFAQ